MGATTLTHGSLDGGGGAPSPALVFARHSAAIAQLVVVDSERVLSVDRNGNALQWNPLTGAVLAQDILSTASVPSSVAVTQRGLAYVVHDRGLIAVDPLDASPSFVQVRTRGLPVPELALCTPDLARVLLASDGEVILLSLADGSVIARQQVETHEPEVLSVHAGEDGKTFVVRFHHVGMDMYPTDDEARYDSATLVASFSPRPTIDRLAPVERGEVQVAIHGASAQLTLADGRRLPDLVGHAKSICRTTWLVVDHVLLTADEDGAILRWDLDHTAAATQHATPVTNVRFTTQGAVSFTREDTKVWRDDALVATLPALPSPRLDDQRVVGTGWPIAIYALDGASLGTCATPRKPSFGERGRICVGFEDAYPNRVISLRDGSERTLPMALDKYLSDTAPPIVHAGRLLLMQAWSTTRSLSLDTLELSAERDLHECPTLWTAAAGDALYSAGERDGRVAASDLVTLARRRYWQVFDEETKITAAVLLPERRQIIVAAKARLRYVNLDENRLLGLLHAPAECVADDEIKMLIAGATEARVVAITAGNKARVLDVERMAIVDPQPGEIDAAWERRRQPAPDGPARGFHTAWVCGDWLVGFSKGHAITPLALVEQPALRAPFSIRYCAIDTLVDDGLGQLWLLRRDGALMRVSLRDATAIETIATIAGGDSLSWVTPTLFAVRNEQRSYHYFRSTGERVGTIALVDSGNFATRALAESAVVEALADRTLVVTRLDATRTRLSDPRASTPATALAIDPPIVASLHGNLVLRWDLRTNACTGAWTAETKPGALDIRADGTILVGEGSGAVTMLR